MGGLLFFVVAATVLNAPIMLGLFLVRKRVARSFCAIALAIGFALAAGLVVYELDWSDVFRHRMPPLGVLVRNYAVLVAGSALTGGLIGWQFPRSSRRAGI